MALPNIDPTQYETQLREKIARYQTDFADCSLPEPAVYRSAPSHYRLRAEFRIWRHRDETGRELIDYAMFDPENPKQPVLMRDYPVACAAICALMPRLRDAVLSSDILRHRYYAVEFLATLSGDMLVTMIYHKKLDSDWESAARALAGRAVELAPPRGHPHHRPQQGPKTGAGKRLGARSFRTGWPSAALPPA